MAEAGLPAPPALQAPQVLQAPLAPQPPTQPVQLPVSQSQPMEPVHVPQLNWSHFKPEFAGKPEDDTEAHLLRINDWMDTHTFQEGVKVQHFCLTLVGEERLWDESLRPINIDWIGLQIQFRQQYSKMGNTREQIFHAWRSFHFSENTETLESYITCIRQVATLLGYEEPQVLEAFNNTLLTRLFCILFRT